MGEMNPHGVTYSTTNGTSKSDDWLKILGGGAGGYLLGRWQEKNCNNNGCNGTPYNGCNTGCSENTLVNRFELEQSQKMADKDATIAYLKGQNESKDYTNAAILELRKELIGRDDKQDAVTADLIKSSITQQTSIASLNSGFDSLSKSTAREFETMAASVNREFRNVNEQFATERAISDRRYVMQPRVRVCATKSELACDETNPVIVSSIGGTVKTTK